MWKLASKTLYKRLGKQNFANLFCVESYHVGSLKITIISLVAKMGILRTFRRCKTFIFTFHKIKYCAVFVQKTFPKLV